MRQFRLFFRYSNTEHRFVAEDDKGCQLTLDWLQEWITELRRSESQCDFSADELAIIATQSFRSPFREPGDKRGVVYLLSHENGYFKIGYTDRLAQRMRTLKSQWLNQVRVIHAFPAHNARKAEGTLHQRYARCMLQGDWFNLTPTDVAEIKEIEGM